MARTLRPAATPRRLLSRPERREAILRAAARAFARTGYAAMSMKEIAATGGITKLIVYRHFDSKETLYRAVLQGVFDRLAARVPEAAEPGDYGIGAATLLAVAREDEAGFRLLWRHACREPRFMRYADDLRAQAVSVARVGLADLVPPENLEWAAHAVVGYVVEAVLNWLEFGDVARDAQFVAATDQARRAGVRAWARPGEVGRKGRI